MTNWVYSIPTSENPPALGPGVGVDLHCRVYNRMRLRVVFGTREVYWRLEAALHDQLALL